MMYSLRQRRLARAAPTPEPVRGRPSAVPASPLDDAQSMNETSEDLTLKLPVLEAEILGLRRLLAEVNANREQLRQEAEDLRRDRDHSAKTGGTGRDNRAARRSQGLVLRSSFVKPFG